MINAGVSVLALLLMAAAAVLPYWLRFPADFDMNWQARNWGLLKISGKFTNLILAGADIAWLDVRDTVCSSAASWTMPGSGGGGTAQRLTGAATALGNMVMGASCPNSCKEHINLRCANYYMIFNLNFAVLGMLFGGGLVSLTGSVMPMIGKERKRDKPTWLGVDVLGFLLAVGGCLVYFFLIPGKLAELRLTSWYQKEQLATSFYIAAAGAALLIVPCLTQLSKILGDTEKKKDGADPLLTGGAAPPFVMPSAI